MSQENQNTNFNSNKRRLSILKAPSENKPQQDKKRRVSFGASSQIITYEDEEKFEKKTSTLVFRTKSVPLNDENNLMDLRKMPRLLDFVKDQDSEEENSNMEITGSMTMGLENENINFNSKEQQNNISLDECDVDSKINVTKRKSLAFYSPEAKKNVVDSRISSLLKSLNSEETKKANTVLSSPEVSDSGDNIVDAKDAEEDNEEQTIIYKNLPFDEIESENKEVQTDDSNKPKITLEEFFSLAHISFESSRFSLGGSPSPKKQNTDSEEKTKDLREQLTVFSLKSPLSQVYQDEITRLEEEIKCISDIVVDVKRELSSNGSRLMRYAEGVRKDSQKLAEFRKALAHVEKVETSNIKNEIVLLENKTNDRVVEVFRKKTEELEGICCELTQRLDALHKNKLLILQQQEELKNTKWKTTFENISANKRKIAELEAAAGALNDVLPWEGTEELRRASQLRNRYQSLVLEFGFSPVRFTENLFQARVGKGKFLLSVTFTKNGKNDKNDKNVENDRNTSDSSESGQIIDDISIVMVSSSNSIAENKANTEHSRENDVDTPGLNVGDVDKRQKPETKIDEHDPLKDFTKINWGDFGELVEKIFRKFDWNGLIFKHFIKKRTGKSCLKRLLTVVSLICDSLIRVKEDLERLFALSVDLGTPLIVSLNKSLLAQCPNSFVSKNAFCHFWLVSKNDKHAHFWLDVELLFLFSVVPLLKRFVDLPRLDRGLERGKSDSESGLSFLENVDKSLVNDMVEFVDINTGVSKRSVKKQIRVVLERFKEFHSAPVKFRNGVGEEIQKRNGDGESVEGLRDIDGREDKEHRDDRKDREKDEKKSCNVGGYEEGCVAVEEDKGNNNNTDADAVVRTWFSGRKNNVVMGVLEEVFRLSEVQLVVRKNVF